MTLLLTLMGLVGGVLLGWNIPLRISSLVARYLSVAILAGLDSVLGGARAELEGDFDGLVFGTGFFANTLLAVGFTYVGDTIGVELYLAAVVALGIRIFDNLGALRRILLQRYVKRGY